MSNSTLGRGKTLPSLFDIGLYVFSFLCPIFFFGKWQLNMVQDLFFVFGTFGLLALSFLCKPQRECNNKYLGFLVLWSLMCVAIHSHRYALREGAIHLKYINFAILLEGFIYILCAAVLFHLVVRYTKNFNLFYPILAINVLNLFFLITQSMGIELIWTSLKIPCGMFGTVYQLKVFSAISIPVLIRYRIKNVWYPFCLIPVINLLFGLFSIEPQLNGLMSVYLALLVYLYFVDRPIRFKWVFFVTIGLIILAFNFNLIYGKFCYRIQLWNISFKEMILHCWVGNGFDISLSQNLVQFKNLMAYRQNDYLNISRDLGVPFLAGVLLFLRSLLVGTKKNYLWVAIVIAMVSSFYQTGMYFVRIACPVIIILALKEKEKYAARE